METDQEFYARRAAEETEAAERATSEEARSVHRQLAAKYADMVVAVPIRAVTTA